jgi:predicted TIM-barrel fold metal-dependent hydrolase
LQGDHGGTYLGVRSRRPETESVARVDLRRPDAEAHLARHAAHPNFRGVRMAEMPDLISGAEFRRGFAALRRRGLSYDLNIAWRDAGEALDLARSSPETPIVVDNMANPSNLDWDLLVEWRRQMRRLAEAPNVTMKISGLGMADHSWTLDRIRPWVLEAIDIFGPSRCMYGTNWPVDSLYGSYRDLVSAYTTIVDAFTEAERNALFAETARRVYRI